MVACEEVLADVDVVSDSVVELASVVLDTEESEVEVTVVVVDSVLDSVTLDSLLVVTDEEEATVVVA